MEDGVKEVERGTEDASRSGKALEEILTQVGEVTAQINCITTAAEQQTATTNEINRSIHDITECCQRGIQQLPGNRYGSQPTGWHGP